MSVIQILYRRYRKQIILALVLVILENIAYIAEPYIFGQAIDGLREARRIEEEVDSSMSSITSKQIADSVRAYVLDSLRTLDSLRKLDSLDSKLEPRMADPSAIEHSRLAGHLSVWSFDPAVFRPTVVHSQVIRPAVYHVRDQLPDLAQDDTTDIEPAPHASLDSLLNVLARRDSLRARAARRHLVLPKNREAARDSIRKQLEKHPPPPRKPADTRTSRPVSFFVPQEVGPFLPPLLPWVMLFVINSSLGALRRLYDTRLYTKMFAKLSSEVVAKQLAQGEELSKVAARSAMSWNSIEFFQYNVPEFIEQLIAVGGAVIALGLFDWRLTVVGSFLIVLVAFGSRFYMRTVQILQVKLHDRYEDEYNIFATRQPHNIRNYYNEIADLEIRLAKRSTASYSVIRVFLLVMFLSTLYISIDLDRFTIGALYSIVAYVWSFVTATEYIPYLSEKWVELKDASRRIANMDNDSDEEEDDEEEEEE